MVTVMPVDQPTADLVVKTLQQARVTCMSPVAALNMHGLLNTDRNARDIRHDTLMNLADQVRRTRVKDLMDAGLIPKEPTPAVVIKAIAGLIEMAAQRAAKGEFR